MPAKWFKCPDGEIIEIEQCLKKKGCRMKQRCATLPFLRLVGYDREWKGVTPSAAGNGPRLLYLRATTDYTIDPQSRVFAALGTGTHDKLALTRYTYNVLSEEPLSDEEMRGISDVLEQDENNEGSYILTDYKTWGSYKVMTALGIYTEDDPIIDDNGDPVLLKSGKNKGEIKTKKVTKINTEKADLENEEYQINRYRIFYEKLGFPVSRLQVQAIPRDGNTYIAKSRGIDKNIYIIPIKRLPDEKVLAYYDKLKGEVALAFGLGWVRKCNKKESWDGRRCEGYCEVSEACKKMEGEK